MVNRVAKFDESQRCKTATLCGLRKSPVLNMFTNHEFFDTSRTRGLTIEIQQN